MDQRLEYVSLGALLIAPRLLTICLKLKLARCELTLIPNVPKRALNWLSSLVNKLAILKLSEKMFMERS